MLSYFNSQCNAEISFGHRVIQDNIVVLAEQIVDFEQGAEVGSTYGEVARDAHVGGVPRLGVVIANVFLLIVATTYVDETVV